MQMFRSKVEEEKKFRERIFDMIEQYVLGFRSGEMRLDIRRLSGQKARGTTYGDLREEWTEAIIQETMRRIRDDEQAKEAKAEPGEELY